MRPPSEYEITTITRQAIADLLRTQGVNWAGRFDEPEFLSRLYDLDTIPSNDHRTTSAAGDIHIHRVSFNDWANDWLFTDSRFDLLHAPDDELLRFPCETVHPEVRPDAAEARALVEAYNRELEADGYALVEVNVISRRPVYSWQKSTWRAQVFEGQTGWQKVDRQVREMTSRLHSAQTEEQYQAVGLICREALISAAHEVFDAKRHPIGDGQRTGAHDIKRMLDAIISAELGGGANEEARAHAKAAINLALALQHKRTADFRTAALCAEGTSSIINILAVLAGRRQPPGEASD
jgi:hypothetical protein